MTPPESKSRFPHISKGFVLAYVFLVGVPILGLAGVLRVGRHISAPISVDGVWKLQNSDLAELSCPQLATALQDGITISQSGKELEVGLGTTAQTAAANLNETTIKGALPVLPACGNDRQLTLVATVDPVANPRTMSGKLTMAGCSSCTPVTIQAVRQVREKPKKAH